MNTATADDRSTPDHLMGEILQNPEDNGPRLVYADWLSERGDPRGSFIVDQCRLAQTDEISPEWAPLHARIERTLFQNFAEWTRPLRELLELPDEEERERVYGEEEPPPFQFCRGFVEGLHARVKDPSKLEAVAKLTPLRDLLLIQGPQTKEMATLAGKLGMKSLEVRVYDWYDDYLEESEDLEDLPLAEAMENLGTLEFVELLDLSKVERLFITGQFDIDGVRQLVQKIDDAPLRALLLAGTGLTSGAAGHLAKGRMMSKLEELDLSSNNIGVQGLRKLVAARGPQPISLSVWGNPKLQQHGHLLIDGRPYRALEIGDLLSDELLDRLEHYPHLGEVRHLRVGMMSSPQMLRLAALPLSGLTRLQLGLYFGNPVDPEMWGVLCASPHLSHLVELSTIGAGLGDEGIAQLIRSPYLTRLTKLDLTSFEMTKEGAVELASWPGLANLVELRLAGNQLGQSGLEALLKSSLDPVRLTIDPPRSNRLRHAMYERFGEAVLDW